MKFSILKHESQLLILWSCGTKAYIYMIYTGKTHTVIFRSKKNLCLVTCLIYILNSKGGRGEGKNKNKTLFYYSYGLFLFYSMSKCLSCLTDENVLYLLYLYQFCMFLCPNLGTNFCIKNSWIVLCPLWPHGHNNILNFVFVQMWECNMTQSMHLLPLVERHSMHTNSGSHVTWLGYGM